jgi:hypothetical protein
MPLLHIEEMLNLWMWRKAHPLMTVGPKKEDLFSESIVEKCWNVWTHIPDIMGFLFEFLMMCPMSLEKRNPMAGFCRQAFDLTKLMHCSPFAHY